MEVVKKIISVFIVAILASVTLPAVSYADHIEKSWNLSGADFNGLFQGFNNLGFGSG